MDRRYPIPLVGGALAGVLFLGGLAFIAPRPAVQVVAQGEPGVEPERSVPQGQRAERRDDWTRRSLEAAGLRGQRSPPPQQLDTAPPSFSSSRLLAKIIATQPATPPCRDALELYEDRVPLEVIELVLSPRTFDWTEAAVQCLLDEGAPPALVAMGRRLAEQRGRAGGSAAAVADVPVDG